MSSCDSMAPILSVYSIMLHECMSEFIYQCFHHHIGMIMIYQKEYSLPFTHKVQYDWDPTLLFLKQNPKCLTYQMKSQKPDAVVQAQKVRESTQLVFLLIWSLRRKKPKPNQNSSPLHTILKTQLNVPPFCFHCISPSFWLPLTLWVFFLFIPCQQVACSISWPMVDFIQSFLQ